ncbi:potential laccase [Uncinocarpus reesii 1704]|uniref:Potential laccase n=1 Tax=Uncinocarpus reesii (strain UAMH 1704) TaxID=336963 RepID=C4JF63_UNCRE|nr:putative laccase [Uncinocarpus reesii 1704]EEP77436.1 potential laccase [Uncinocarpus reesii 1704]
MKFLEACFVACFKLLFFLALWADHAAAVSVPRQNLAPGPIFSPPPNVDSPNNVIQCQYPAMRGWQHDASDKRNWLKWTGPGPAPEPGKYGITTDYEMYTPTGIIRRRLAGEMISVSPFDLMTVQYFYLTSLEITVTNRLEYNGTAIHMHGLRMLNTNLHDGVPGVTQCPIAPGDSFTYRFKAIQYGSTWYHSHYSLQYTDGLVGPLTIHGPSSSDYDESIDPLLMTDHIHRSAFAEYHIAQTGPPPRMSSILLNGIGSYAGLGGNAPTRKYSTLVQKGKKYLLRLINTSTDATFVFSIDNHNFTVIGADFVPMRPYDTDHIVVGIGQRYHVIVNTLSDVDNGAAFWIRTVPTTGCSRFETDNPPDERTGILYYGERSSTLPTSTRHQFPLDCRDEPFDRLKPYHPWQVPDPMLDASIFDTSMDVQRGTWVMPERPSNASKVSFWKAGPSSMYLNYSQPMVKSLDRTSWDDTWVVYPSEDHTLDSWVYLLVTGFKESGNDGQARVAHPMHFHGHDFALLQQSEVPYQPSAINLTLDNPPRRDVVLLPSNGFVVIGFRADNPGSWVMHCHIAWHASLGLALQILERKDDFIAHLESRPRDVREMERVCTNWDTWFSNPANHWDPDGFFQDDSGI